MREILRGKIKRHICRTKFGCRLAIFGESVGVATELVTHYSVAVLRIFANIGVNQLYKQKFANIYRSVDWDAKIE